MTDSFYFPRSRWLQVLCGLLVTLIVLSTWTNTVMMHPVLNESLGGEEYNKKYMSSSSSSSTGGPQCLGLGFEEGMDKLLSKRRPVFVVMPSKASGQSFGLFTRGCMKHQGIEPITQKDWNHQKGFLTRKVLTENFQMPTLITTHILLSKELINLTKQSVKNALIIYVHREETERLKSSIQHVVNKRKCCNVTESKVVDLIAEASEEIHITGTKLLTCEAYQAIEDNAPNLVFMHYTQASKMFPLLAKHFCPGVRVNEGNDMESTNEEFWVELSPSSKANWKEDAVNLNEWLDEKIDMLELTFDLKSNVTCQATTRKMEHDLFSCPDETLHYSSADFFRS